jgi:CheY-like chemotaxis protein
MPAFLSQVRRVISHNCQQQATPGITIMVADQELPQLLLAGTTLHQLGSCQVLLARGATDALHRLQNTHPEYLILDTLMPHNNVYEFIHQFRKMEWLKNTKIILASPEIPDPPPEYDGQPIIGAVTRPFTPAALLQELRKMIPALPPRRPNHTHADPRLLELEIQRILALKI